MKNPQMKVIEFLPEKSNEIHLKSQINPSPNPKHWWFWGCCMLNFKNKDISARFVVLSDVSVGSGQFLQQDWKAATFSDQNKSNKFSVS